MTKIIPLVSQLDERMEDADLLLGDGVEAMLEQLDNLLADLSIVLSAEAGSRAGAYDSIIKNAHAFLSGAIDEDQFAGELSEILNAL